MNIKEMKDKLIEKMHKGYWNANTAEALFCLDFLIDNGILKINDIKTYLAIERIKGEDKIDEGAYWTATTTKN